MSCNIRNVFAFFIYMSVFFLPFISSIGGISSLGWLGKELSFYPLSLGTLIWLLYSAITREKIHIPRNNSIRVMALFISVIVVSDIVNIRALFNNDLGPRNAVIISLTQVCLLIFFCMSSLYIYNWLKITKNTRVIYKWMVYSFVVSFVYNVIELFKICDLPIANSIIHIIDQLFRMDEYDSNYGRIRGLASEASYFGMYTAFIMPWIISLVFLTEKMLKKVLIVFVLLVVFIMVIYSKSRVALVSIILEFIIYYWINHRISKKMSVATLIVCPLVIVMLYFFGKNTIVYNVLTSLSIDHDGGYSYSNLARIGSWIAGVNIFLENPVFGVGYGVVGSMLSSYYPIWCIHVPEIQEWIMIANAHEGLLSTHNLYSKLLAETGIVGFSVWGFYCYVSMDMMLDMIKNSSGKKNYDYYYRLNITISLIAVMLFGFNVDGFKYMHYWIIFALTWHENSVYRSQML